MKIFNKFARLAIKYESMNICDIYNHFLKSKISDEERKFAINNCMLLMKVGESARKAPESIKKEF